MKTPIDALHEDFKGVLARLGGDMSLHNSVSDIFRKFLLLAAASYFEKHLTETVVDFAKKSTSENHLLPHLVRETAVKRQYHTWFVWERANANKFFSLFGKDFRAHMEKELGEKREDIKDAVKAFMEIGRERNRLAHEGIVGCSFEKTSDEVYATYERALRFVEWFPVALAEFAENPSPPAE
ncbi:MAG: HEPN domain-containing protein [Gammaproteobacteria bacterium]